MLRITAFFTSDGDPTNLSLDDIRGSMRAAGGEVANLDVVTDEPGLDADQFAITATFSDPTRWEELKTVRRTFRNYPASQISFTSTNTTLDNVVVDCP